MRPPPPKSPLELVCIVAVAAAAFATMWRLMTGADGRPGSSSHVAGLTVERVQSVRLDHERTRLGVWSSGRWAITPGGGDADVATLNAAYRDAQRHVAAAAGDPDGLGRARRQAEQVLAAFAAALGWAVEVRWST